MEYELQNARRRRLENTAVGLGWFSIALGTTELLFGDALARMMGMPKRSGVVRLFGVREIATGIGLLSAKDRQPWLWGRVAGDGLDMALLAANVDDNPRPGNLAMAIGAVAGATMLDAITAEGLAKCEVKDQKAQLDFSDRSGFPRGIEAARGLAAYALKESAAKH
jgi:hypothetical protein